jgi:hypothetical protein
MLSWDEYRRLYGEPLGPKPETSPPDNRQP